MQTVPIYRRESTSVIYCKSAGQDFLGQADYKNISAATISGYDALFHLAKQNY